MGPAAASHQLGAFMARAIVHLGPSADGPFGPLNSDKDWRYRARAAVDGSLREAGDEPGAIDARRASEGAREQAARPVAG